MANGRTQGERGPPSAAKSGMRGGTGMALVQRFEIRKTRRGENFGSLKINLGRAGGFGTLDAKIWQFDKFTGAGRELPRQGSLIEAKYRADEYNGLPQWTIEDYRILEGEEREAALEAFVPDNRIDRAFYEAKFEELLGEADERRVSTTIARKIFGPEDFRQSFFTAPAAVAHHQSYPGGLLEHTLNVTLVALAIADVYTQGAEGGLSFNRERLQVDRTLLICAGLLHDIGKVSTYRLAPISEPTDLNRFEGHLAISYAVIREVAAPLRESPPYEGAADEIDKLLNCILSHHGQLEYGSPVLPACLEAFVLSQADLTDARLASIVNEGNNLLRQSPGARWLRHFHFPSGMFVGDWPEPPKA